MEANVKTWSNAQFVAETCITFTLPIGVALPERSMKAAVLTADRLSPWRCSYVSGESAPSIHWFSEPKFKTEGGGVDRLYEMAIRPPFLLKASELTAYYNYAIKLGSELVTMALPNVIAIGISVDFRVGTTYYIPAEDRATSNR